MINNKVSTDKSNVWVKNHHPSKRLPLTQKNISDIINSVFKGERKKYSEININFVTDSNIRKINKNYLKHDYVTDIITFVYSGNGNIIDCEMFISAAQVKKNSNIYKTSYVNELQRVLIHGCLHALGYNDKSESQKKVIRKKEGYYLDK